MPSSLQPSAATTAAMDLMVPELPTAEAQPERRKSSRTGRTSRAPASSAFSMALGGDRPSAKWRRDMLTQPMCRLSRRPGGEALADDELGAAAADVHHQAALGPAARPWATPR
jgi:hypothetical protein